MSMRASNLLEAFTLSIPIYSGAAVGDVVDADKNLVDAIGDNVLGVVVDVGVETVNVMLCGLVEGLTGLTSGADQYSDGDGTYSESEPAGAAGTKVCTIGFAVGTTAILIRPQIYEKGA